MRGVRPRPPHWMACAGGRPAAGAKTPCVACDAFAGKVFAELFDEVADQKGDTACHQQFRTCWKLDSY